MKAMVKLMSNISNKDKEKELIGLFLTSRIALDIAIENKFFAEETVDEFNKTVIELILSEARYDVDFIPTIPHILNQLEYEPKDEKKARLTLSRYRKMVQREIMDESQIPNYVKEIILELRDLSIKRKAINVIRKGLDDIGGTAREFISNINKGLNEIEINDGIITEVQIFTGFKDLKEQMIYQVENDIEFGFKFGLRDFDAMTQNQIALGTLTYIVGRPSNYKTGTALNLAQNAAQNYSIPTALLSNEMGVHDVYRRLLSRVSSIEMNKLKNPKDLTKEEWAKIDEAIKLVEEWPLYVIDSSRLNITQIDSVVAYLKTRYGVQLVFQDYFQLIRTKKGNIPSEEWEFGHNSEELRMIAKNHEVAFVSLSQANRSCEARDDKRPTLKDIRNTGKAEQDAHNIFYVYRDDFYYGSKSELVNHLEIGALKVREGELRRALFHFNGAKATIGNCDPLAVMDKPVEYVGGGGMAE